LRQRRRSEGVRPHRPGGNHQSRKREQVNRETYPAEPFRLAQIKRRSASMEKDGCKQTGNALQRQESPFERQFFQRGTAQNKELNEAQDDGQQAKKEEE